MALQNWGLLEIMADYLHVKIDPNKPRDSRLVVALRYDDLGSVPEAIEAMTAVQPHLYDREKLESLMLARIVAKDPCHFYEGFPPVDK
ncbi:MAG: hypothetical protein V1837_03425 [Candidatus Woesearchaeota archaeon]